MAWKNDRRHYVADGKVPLNPCPFCASTDLGFYEHVYSKDFAVICNVCGGEGPKRADHHEAAYMWNKRTEA